MFKYKIIDAHCDILSLMAHYAADLQEINNHISIEKLTKGNVYTIFAAWTNPVDKPNSYLESGLKLIDTYNNMLDMYRHILCQFYTMKMLLMHCTRRRSDVF